MKQHILILTLSHSPRSTPFSHTFFLFFLPDTSWNYSPFHVPSHHPICPRLPQPSNWVPCRVLSPLLSPLHTAAETTIKTQIRWCYSSAWLPVPSDGAQDKVPNMSHALQGSICPGFYLVPRSRISSQPLSTSPTCSCSYAFTCAAWLWSLGDSARGSPPSAESLRGPHLHPHGNVRSAWWRCQSLYLLTGRYSLVWECSKVSAPPALSSQHLTQPLAHRRHSVPTEWIS